MTSKFVVGKKFAVWACMTWLASVSVGPLAAQLPAVLQVPTATRVAGNTVSGYNGDYGSAVNVDLNGPIATVFDAAGNQYISDTKNNCIRKVTPGTPAIMSVLVGYESTPASTDTCNASSLTPTPVQGLLGPQGLTIDAAGDLFIADSGHNCIRELPANATGSRSLINVVDTCLNYGSTAATALSVSPNPQGLVLDPEGDEIWTSFAPAEGISQVMFHKESVPADPPTAVCDIAGTPVAGHANVCTFYNGQGLVLNDPTGIALDGAGDYFLSDTGNACVRELSASQIISTPVGQCASDGTGSTAIPNFAPVGIVAGDQGYVYITNTAQNTVLQYQGQGTTPVLIAGVPNVTTPYTGAQDGKAAVVVSLNQPIGLSIDPSGNLYVADSGNGIIRQLAYNSQFPSENLNTPSGGQNLQFEINANVNLAASFTSEYGVSLGNNTCAGALAVSTGATPTTCVVSVQFDPQYPGPRRAPLTLTDSSASPAAAYQFGLSGTGIGSNALFIPGTIRTTLASLNNPSAVVVGTTGNVYFAESGASSGNGDIQLIAAGSSTATTLVPAGKIQSPVALALDAAQNLYVADSATNTIYKVDANGNVTTFAAGLNGPIALSVDNFGNVYVAQNGAGAGEVIKIFAGGQQLVVAGGGTNATPNGVPATQAQFVKPSGLYVDPSGIMYISDEGAFRVYSVDPTGTIHYFAGNGTQSNTETPPVLPTDAGLQGPTSVVGDAAGDIYITDGAANLIYVVFGGSNQNPGIEALVGTGTPCTTAPCGDGGAANLSELNNPVSVSLDGADDLYLVDAGTNSIRKVNYQDPTLDFGYVKPGNTSGPLITQLWDAGNQQPGLAPLTSFPPVENAPAGITNAFTQVSNGCGATLPTGSTCSLSYSFTAPYNPPTAPVYGLYEALASSNASAVDIPQVITLVADVPQITFVTPPVTAVYGTSYALTASVTAPGAPTPTGTVTFAITGPSAQTLCGGPITLPASGTVSCPSTSTFLDVGVYPILVSYSGDNNYLPATQTTTLTITPAPVVITATNFTRPYNTPNPTFTGTITGVVQGQSITDTYSTTATQTSAPGTYPIVPANPATAGPGTSLSNYAITYVNGTLTITKNSGGVTISSPAVSTVYGTAYTIASSITSTNLPTPSGTATFTIGSQTLCAAAPLSATGTAACMPSPTLENVGTYSVTVAYSGDDYYPASTGTIALTITPAPVTITAANATRPFGTPNPTLTGTVSGVVAGQSITDTYTTTAVQTSAPGSYPITPTNPATAGSGTLLTNYAITYVNGTLTITQAGGPSLSTPAVTTVYGNAYTLAATVSSGLTPAPTGMVTFTVGGQPICPAATLGSSGTVTCTPSPTLENAGTYSVAVSYSGDQTYPPTATNLALTITPAPVTITANNATRTTGVANPNFTGVITGVVTGQSITATFASPATISSPAGNYPIVPTPVIGSGTLAANYTISVVNGILTITQGNTPPISPTGSFSLKATPAEQEIDTTGSVNFPVTLTSIDGFTDLVAMSCSGLPEGVGCSFAPGALQPAANGTAVSVMTITGTADGTNVPNGSFGALRPMSPAFKGSPANGSSALSSVFLAWTMLPIGFTGSAASLLFGFKRRKGFAKMSVLWIVPLLLFMAGLAGCGAPNNYKIYTVTITATDSTYATPVTQTTTVQLVLAK